MSSTHKISALRSLATKVALGLGIALVASSIAPMAVAPASATGNDVVYVPFLGLLKAYEVGGVQAHQGTVVGAAPNAMYMVSDNNYIFGPGRYWPMTGGNSSTAMTPPTGATFETFQPVIDGSYIYFKVSYAGSSTYGLIRTALSGISATPTWETVLSGLAKLDAFTVTGSDIYYGQVTAVYGSPSHYTGTVFKHTIGSQASDVTLGNAFNLNQMGAVSFEGMVVLGSKLIIGVSDNSWTGQVGYSGPEGYLAYDLGGAWSLNTVTINTLSHYYPSMYVSAFNGSLYITGNNTFGGGMAIYKLSFTGNDSVATAVASIQSPTAFFMSTVGAPAWAPAVPHTQSFDPNGGLGGVANLTSSSAITFPSATHSDVSCTFMGWSDTSTDTIGRVPGGASRSYTTDRTWYAVWSSASCRTSAPSVSTADARPTPQLDLSGLSVIPAPAVGATAGAAGIDLKGKNLPTVASVTVAGKDGKVVTSTETALKLELPTLAPGSYDIVMKTEGNGSITIQNGLVIAAPAPKVDPTPIPPVVITPSIPRTTLVAASTPVPGFLPGKAGVSEAQKAIIQDVVLTKNVTSLECVGVTNAKVSAKLASARAASICAAAKAQNADLTTSVKTIAEAKVNGPIGSVLINYNH
jgi:hypothetical protein